MKTKWIMPNDLHDKIYMCDVDPKCVEVVLASDVRKEVERARAEERERIVEKIQNKIAIYDNTELTSFGKGRMCGLREATEIIKMNADAPSQPAPLEKLEDSTVTFNQMMRTINAIIDYLKAEGGKV